MSLTAPELPFVPGVVRRRLADLATTDRAPTAASVWGAVAILDLSGFSRLAARLASAGPDGADRLVRALDQAFAALLGVVSASGGDAVTFAGDAVIVRWPAPADQLAEAIDAAIVAAHHALTAVEASNDQGLSLHAGIAAGEARLLLTPEASGDWLVALAGPPVAAAGTALDRTRAGQICVDPGAWAQVVQLLPGRTDPDGTGWPSPPARTWSDELAPGPESAPALPPELLRAFVPLPARERLAAGHDAWLGELRQTTSVFVALADWPADATAQLARAAAVVDALGPIFRARGAWFRGLLVDDKGATAIAFFGTPGSVHEDSARRALLAARQAFDDLSTLGVHCRVGVASGRAFCGPVGTPERRDYTVIGDPVNLAARLAAAADAEVLCDEATARGAAGAVVLERLPPRTLKGQQAGVTVHRVGAPAARADLVEPGARAGSLVGRAEERDALVISLGRLEGGGAVRWVLEGEAGIGKSRLLADVLGVARSRGLAVLSSANDPGERASAGQALRPLARQLLATLVGEGRVATPEVLSARLAATPELVDRLPLLHGLGLLDLPDNELTAGMAGEVRTQNLARLLAGLLRAAHDDRPVLVVIEDVHWMDAASWSVLEAVAAQVSALGLLLTSRPLDREGATARDALERLGVDHLVLRGLPPAAVADLLADTLGVRQVPALLLDVVAERAQGNPFFASEIALALRDAGVLHVEGDRAVLADEVRDTDALAIPATVEAVVASRIDRLPARHQLTLKVASVIGRSFAYRAIEEVHPVDRDRDELPEVLDELARVDLTSVEHADPDLTYAFKHALTRDIAYGMLPLDRRRLLHRAVAAWLERLQQTERVPCEALIAHHHGLAGDTEAQAAWLVRAARAAHELGSPHEVATLAGACLELVEDGRAHVDFEVLTELHRLLGEAMYGVGRFPEARDHLRRALGGMGVPVPTGLLPRALGLLRVLVRLALRRWGLARGGGRPDLTPERRELLGMTTERIGQVSYVLKDNLGFVESLLLGLDALEPHGLTPQLGRIEAGATLLAQLVGLGGVARDYDQRADRAEHELTDRSALGWIGEVRGMYRYGDGRLAEAREAYDRGLGAFETLGHAHGAAEVRSLHMYACLAQGDLDAARPHLEARLAYGRAQRNAYVLSHGHVVLAWLAGLQGDVATARAQQAEVAAHDDPTNAEHALNDATVRAWIAQLDDDEPARAAALADGLAALAQVPPTLVYLLPQLTILADAACASARQDASSIGAARAVHKALGGYARTFPLGRPALQRITGQLALARGRTAQGRRQLERAVEAAAAQGQRLEQAAAHVALARDGAGDDHLARARQALGGVAVALEVLAGGGPTGPGGPSSRP
ncbi:MAG: AAA family ATPase [Alphaproteobacteria bacterium]|nr:AAA family ATPase [Alphaproteobacteria bacterium]